MIILTIPGQMFHSVSRFCLFLSLFQLPVRGFSHLLGTYSLDNSHLSSFLLRFLPLIQPLSLLCLKQRAKSSCQHGDGRESGDRCWACRRVSFWDYLGLKQLWAVKTDFCPVFPNMKHVQPLCGNTVCVVSLGLHQGYKGELLESLSAKIQGYVRIWKGL